MFIDFPDIPGVNGCGKTFEDAQKDAKEALVFHVEALVSEGVEIPEPTKTLKEILDRGTLPFINYFEVDIQIPKRRKSAKILFFPAQQVPHNAQD